MEILFKFLLIGIILVIGLMLIRVFRGCLLYTSPSPRD